MSDSPPTDDPARANAPDAPGSTPGVADRVSPGAPPPGSNQRKDEPIPPARDVSDDTDTIASTHPQSPHAVPHAVPRGVDVQEPSGRRETRESPLDPVAELDAARTSPGAPAQSVLPGPPSPGNAQGVSVPATESAPGTSQDSSIVEGVRSSPGAVPGAPDGESRG